MNQQIGIAILARAPVAGQAKTRLIPALGAVGAACLQGWMLRRTVALALEAGTGPVSLWWDGDPAHTALAECRTQGPIAIRQQVPEDLGRRMLAAIEASPTAAGTLVIGTDCPALTAMHLRHAARRLDHADAVLVPAEDGGYVLIGTKCAVPEVFSAVDWGTDVVMEQTRKRLLALGWRWEELETLWDVDRPADLDRLYALYPALRETLAVASSVG